MLSQFFSHWQSEWISPFVLNGRYRAFRQLLFLQNGGYMFNSGTLYLHFPPLWVDSFAIFLHTPIVLVCTYLLMFPYWDLSAILVLRWSVQGTSFFVLWTIFFYLTLDQCFCDFFSHATLVLVCAYLADFFFYRFPMRHWAVLTDRCYYITFVLFNSGFGYSSLISTLFFPYTPCFGVLPCNFCPPAPL